MNPGFRPLLELTQERAQQICFPEMGFMRAICSQKRGPQSLPTEWPRC